MTEEPQKDRRAAALTAVENGNRCWEDRPDVFYLKAIALLLMDVDDKLAKLVTPCRQSNIFELGERAVYRTDDPYLAECERPSGHPNDFHEGGGKRWSA